MVWLYGSPELSTRMVLGDPRFVNLSRVVPPMMSEQHAAQLRQVSRISENY